MEYKNFLLSALLLFIPSLHFGCQAIEQKSILMERDNGKYQGEFRITPKELRIRLNSLAERFAGIIEEIADQILSETTSVDVRRNTLLWKMNSIPAV